MPVGSRGEGREVFRGYLLILLGGLHYGYNNTIVSATLDKLKAQFDHDNRESLTSLETLLGCTLLGAIFGSPISGTVVDTYGRRVGTVVGETLSVIGTVGCATSQRYWTLIAFRFVIGLGVGFCTLAKPIYVSETIADAGTRGAALASFSPALGAGILIATMVSSALSSWRLQMALGGVPPALLLAIGIFAMPESATWQAARKQKEEICSASEHPEEREQKEEEGHGLGSDVFCATQQEDAVEGQSDDSAVRLRLLPDVPTGTDGGLAQGGAADAEEGEEGRGASGASPVLTRQLVEIALVAVVIGVSMQGTGDLPLVVYCKQLLAAAGNTAASAGFAATITSTCNLAGALVGCALVKFVPSRLLYLVGLTGMTICLVALALLLLPSVQAGPQIGPGCCYYVLITELPPKPLKTFAYTVGNSAKYLFELVNSFFFFSLTAAIGTANVMWIYCAFCLVSLGAGLTFLRKQ